MKTFTGKNFKINIVTCGGEDPFIFVHVCIGTWRTQFHETGPIDALKASVNSKDQDWAEKLVEYYTKQNPHPKMLEKLNEE